jgi:hypothetical protein
MKYLIVLFLLVSPGFDCEHRSSFLHKTSDFKLLFWGLSSQETLVEIYQNNKSLARFASATDARGKMCLVSQGQGFSTISPCVSAGFSLSAKQIDLND